MFCHSIDMLNMVNLKIIFQKIIQAKTLGIKVLLLSGGEPTISKELFKIIQFIKQNGMDFGMISNLRMFALEGFTHKIQKFKPKFIQTSIHGSNFKIHDAISNTKGSFEQVTQGIKNINKIYPDINIVVNIVINKVNLADLENTINLIHGLDIHKIRLSAIIPEGRAKKDMSELMPKISVSAKRAVEALKYANNRFRKLDVKLDYFPLCLIKDNIHNVYDFSHDNIELISNTDEHSFFDVDVGTRIKGYFCKGCQYTLNCKGVYKEYLEEFGISEFTNSMTISNSILYQIQRKYDPKYIHNTCCKGTCANFNPIKSIFIEYNDKILHYQTNSYDFSNKEVLEAKNNEQIYLDKMTNSDIEDFGKDKLELSLKNECKICGKKDLCPNIFYINPKNKFQKDDSKVVSIIKRISGNVLDIGVGNTQYLSILKTKIDTKEINYIGIDPDKEVISRNKEQFKGGRLLATTIEDLEIENIMFDYILLLRSFNHIKDIEKSLDKIHTLLKKNGKLIIVDNCTYGIIKSVSDDSNQPKGLDFEHYRNYNDIDTLNICKLHGFNLDYLIDKVTPNSSNQWGIVLKK
ncbi:MAG: methyltransferase [Candidatus Cloacimonetes bacterium]|nr:methyltransferase [Candidatus Cloacimonadota bacterium]